MTTRDADGNPVPNFEDPNFKKVMQWLGILVLPEEGEYDGYPTQSGDEEPTNP